MLENLIPYFSETSLRKPFALPRPFHGTQIKPSQATWLHCSVLEQLGVYWYQHQSAQQSSGAKLHTPHAISPSRLAVIETPPDPSILCKCLFFYLELCINTSPINISLARVHFCPFTAGVALDVAAPKKLAVALPHARVLVRVVSSAAAH